MRCDLAHACRGDAIGRGAAAAHRAADRDYDRLSPARRAMAAALSGRLAGGRVQRPCRFSRRRSRSARSASRARPVRGLAAPLPACRRELSRERLKAALSAAEGLLLQPRGEGELIELSDDEAVAAAVMLPMVAADRLAPSASSHTGGAFKRNVRGIV